jgi:hypothetical protein
VLQLATVFSILLRKRTNPKELDPKKTLIKIQLISDRVNESRARSVKVVRNPVLLGYNFTKIANIGD